MATVEVKAELREAGTKGHARKLRQLGRIPAVVYGEGEESVPVALDAAAFELMLRHISSGNQILDLKVRGREASDYKVLIKEVQRNPVNERVIHVDLQHISMTHKVRVHVPIHLTGTPLGVKEGGILEHLLREIEVECLPTEIPGQFELNVSDLIRGQSIHVRDLPTGGIHVLESPDRVIATVVGKAKEEEPTPAPAVEGEAAAPAGEEAKGAATKEAGKGAPAKDAPKGQAKDAPKGPAKDAGKGSKDQAKGA